MTAKIAAVIAGLALVMMSFVSFAPAKAQTNSDLQAQINSLLATIRSLQAQLGQSGGTTTTVSSTVFTRDLTIGSTGSDVTALQTWLIGKGYAIPAGATGYFGTQTQAAVAAFQTANGIMPTAGYFGPVTRTRVVAIIAATNPGTSNPGGTTGGGTTLSGNGRLTNVDTSGDITSDLNEGDNSTAVLAVSADAQGGDVQIQRVDVDFTVPSGSGSSNLNKYVNEVALYLNNTKLATMNADEGDKNSRTWTFRFADLPSSAIIRSGSTGTLSVRVTPVESIGDNESNQNVTVEIPQDGIRAVAADGISETYGGSSLNETFSVSTAATGDATVSEGSNNPDDSVVKVDTNNTTDNVTLMELNVRARNQDIKINDLPIQLSTSDAIGDVVQTVKLMDGSKTIDSKSVTGSGTTANIVFDNIDQNVNQGDTNTYTIVATLKKLSGNYPEGTTLVASTTNSLAWDVEDTNGNNVDIGGSATGGTLTLNSGGFNVEAGSTSSNVVPSSTNSDAYGTFTIKFDVTANEDEPVYIAKTAANTGTAGAVFNILKNGTVYTGATDVVSDQLTSNADTVGGVYKVNAGDTQTFTLTVTVDPLTVTGAGQYAIELAQVHYSVNSDLSNLQTFTVNTDNADFETNPVYITAD